MKAGRKIVFAALFANMAIAAIKFLASVWTGSSAMLSEAIHSSVDTGNQGLLLYGRRRASLPADEGHPFGHGMELFFWGFVVALLIFSFGGALSIYEGILKIADPQPITDPWINFAILGAAGLFEGYSFRLAWREMRRTYPDKTTYSAVKASKDPSIFVILMEDAAALSGLAIAAAGLILALWLNQPMFDGIASVGIGLLLLATAVLLARETRSLLTGESASQRVLEGVRRILRDDQRVDAVTEMLSMQIGADAILLALSVRFRPAISALEVERAQHELAERIEGTVPEIRRAFVRSATV